MIKSPSKFLDSFTLADRAIFFGRDQELTELCRRVFESKILLVYGVSGTGKTSLINCIKKAETLYFLKFPLVGPADIIICCNHVATSQNKKELSHS
jgi:MoxR-like ATPase